jgi:putative transposase
MTMRAYKLRLYPNAEQRGALNRYFGSARWTWNRSLEYRTKAYRRRGESVTGIDFSRLLTRLKRTDRYGWLKATPATVLVNKLRHQDQAFKNFFAGRAKYPRFKKRGHAEAVTFQIDARQVKRRREWDGGKIVVPGLGTIRYRGSNHPRQMPKLVTIRRDACGQYHASFAVEADIRSKPAATGSVGIDLGIKHLATLSDGRKIANPKHYDRRFKQLRHRQKTLSRRVKGSNRFRDARQRVARVHQRIRDSRADALHKLTTRLIGENQAVCIEDLHVRGLVRNRRLARSIADTGFGELRRQLEYKSAWYGRTLIVVNRWFPSSKRCSSCGHTLETLNLATRHWTCPACGADHDRDKNAAVNILNEGLRQSTPAGGRCGRVEGRGAGGDDNRPRETAPNEARIVGAPSRLSGTAAAG